jgi:pimeloyl-ACP methyl ester carboxylesterase
VAAVNFRATTIAAAGRRIAVAEAGAGDTLVWLGGSADVTRAQQRLAARRRVVVLTAPGGDKLGALGLDRFDLVGKGHEARAALEFALAQPERLRALVLLGPTAIGAGDDGLTRRLAELKPPSLALFGTRDRDAPPETARRYRERIPGCNLVFVYDAGAAMDDERPEAVAAVIEEFLERHDRFLVSRESGLLYP